MPAVILISEKCLLQLSKILKLKSLGLKHFLLLKAS